MAKVLVRLTSSRSTLRTYDAQNSRARARFVIFALPAGQLLFQVPNQALGALAQNVSAFSGLISECPDQLFTIFDCAQCIMTHCLDEFLHTINWGVSGILALPVALVICWEPRQTENSLCVANLARAT